MTYDVDITVQIDAEKVESFIKACEELDFYIVPERVHHAIQTGTDFQIIDISTSLKADFYAVHPQLSLRQQQTLERARVSTYGHGDKTAFFMSPKM